MSAALKVLPQTLVGLVLLAAITIFGYTGHLTAADTYALILGLIGLVGVTGIYVLASTWDNVNALPHLVVGIAIVASIVVLGVHDVFTSNQSLAVLGLLLTGTAGSIGVVAADTAPQKVVGDLGSPR